MWEVPSVQSAKDLMVWLAVGGGFNVVIGKRHLCLCCLWIDQLLGYCRYFLTESLEIVSTTMYQQQDVIRTLLAELIEVDVR